MQSWKSVVSALVGLLWNRESAVCCKTGGGLCCWGQMIVLLVVSDLTESVVIHSCSSWGKIPKRGI